MPGDVSHALGLLCFFRAEVEAEETAEIKACSDQNCRRHRSRRIAAELKIGRHRVLAVMRAENPRAIGRREFTPQTTDSKHGQTVSLNLLKHRLKAPRRKGDVFVGDITYRQLIAGDLCYLACLRTSSRAESLAGRFPNE